MSLQSPTISERVALVSSGRTLGFNTIAAGTFTFWEFFITLDQEINYIWRRKWSMINCLFIFIRYGSFFVRIAQLMTDLSVHPSVKTCKNVVNLGAIGGHIMLFAVEVLLAIRTYAFYGQNRKMMFLLFGTVFAGQVASITILVIVLPSYVSNAAVSGDIGACIVVAADPRSPQYLLITLIVEGFLTFLVAIKFFYNHVMRRAPASHTLMVFIRDGAWAFGLVLVGVVWTVGIYNTDAVQGDIAITWLFALISFSGTRLILNLRSESPQNNMFTGTYTTANLAFRGRTFGETQNISQTNNVTYPNLDNEYPSYESQYLPLDVLRSAPGPLDQSKA